MRYRRESSGRLLVSLTAGDDLRACLQGLAADLGLGGAEVSGIGALADPELGYWDLQQRLYHKQVFGGVFELLSLKGNLTLLQDRPFLHAHVTLSGPDYRVFGGHLFEARVGVVAELFLTPCEAPLRRLDNAELGLPRWEPGGN